LDIRFGGHCCWMRSRWADVSDVRGGSWGLI
jgi:hypothetical protein